MPNGSELVQYLKTLDKQGRAKFLLKYAKLHGATLEWYFDCYGIKHWRRKKGKVSYHDLSVPLPEKKVTLGQLQEEAGKDSRLGRGPYPYCGPPPCRCEADAQEVRYLEGLAREARDRRGRLRIERYVEEDDR